MDNEKIEILKSEYALLKIYQKDARDILSYLEKNHFDIWKKVINTKTDRIEVRMQKIKGNEYE